MRILFVATWYPCPIDNGAKVRIYNLIRALARRHEVTLVAFVDPGIECDPNSLSPYCRVAAKIPRPIFHPSRPSALLGYLSTMPRSVVDTFSPAMADVVQQEIQRGSYDLAIANDIYIAYYLRNLKGLPRLIDGVEFAVIHEDFARAADSLARLRLWLTWSKTKRYLKWLLRPFAACTVVSLPDLTLLHEVLPSYDSVQFIPNGVDVVWARMDGVESHSHTLIYNGSLTFHANMDAMSYFVDSIWPRIRASEPSTVLKITGRTSPAVDAVPLPDGITLTGYLSDIRPAVAEAWACVVPLRKGAGTRLKILEAMALGTPVISTSKGAEGLNVTSEENILLADNPDDFARQTVRLLRDPLLRERLACNGRQLVEAQYDWRSIGDDFVRWVESVVASERGHGC